MGSQSRLSLSATGLGNAHYPKRDIEQIKIALNDPPDEAGQKLSAKILLSVLATNNPFFASIISAISLLVIIQKNVHYAEIADKQGTEAAIIAIISDIADGVIRQYITDTTVDSLITSESISPELRDQIEMIVGMVVDQGIDEVEEAFLNE